MESIIIFNIKNIAEEKERRSYISKSRNLHINTVMCAKLSLLAVVRRVLKFSKTRNIKEKKFCYIHSFAQFKL